MPKKRKATRRRRMGAASKKVNTERLLGLVLGAVGTGFINKMITDMKPDDPNIGKIAAGGSVLLGIFLPSFVKGNNLVQGIGDGMVAAGGLGTLREFGVLNGIPVVSGYLEMNKVNGLPKELEVYEEQPQKKFAMSNVINGMNAQYDERRLG